MEETKERRKPLKPPAITLCPVNSNAMGWKFLNEAVWYASYHRMCNGKEHKRDHLSEQKKHRVKFKFRVPGVRGG